MRFEQQIESVLAPLKGLALSATSRAASMVMFGFGELHDRIGLGGQRTRWPAFSLHVQTAWRITGPAGVVVGSNDLFYPAADPLSEPPEWEWDVPGANRSDHQLDLLVTTHVLLVERVVASALGDLDMLLSDDHRLQVFMLSGVPEESWRFLGERHLVVMPSKFEFSRAPVRGEF